jgi:hypothetical protein
MSNVPVGVLIFVVVLVLGAIAVGLIVFVRKRRRRLQMQEEQDRQLYRSRLLSSLETLDLALTNLNTAAHRGNEHLARERVSGLARAVGAANLSGDDELRRLVSVMAMRSDALVKAGRKELGEEDLNLLVRQIGETQQHIYRRMEVLLDQAFD